MKANWTPAGAGQERTLSSKEEPLLGWCKQEALTCDSATPVASLTLPNITSIWYMLQRCLSSSSLWRWWSCIVSSDCSSTWSRWVCLSVGDSQGHRQNRLQIGAWGRGQERIWLSLDCGEQDRGLGLGTGVQVGVRYMVSEPG